MLSLRNVRNEIVGHLNSVIVEVLWVLSNIEVEKMINLPFYKHLKRKHW